MRFSDGYVVRGLLHAGSASSLHQRAPTPSKPLQRR
jgi:hypothetical protein